MSTPVEVLDAGAPLPVEVLYDARNRARFNVRPEDVQRLLDQVPCVCSLTTWS